jgi:hypothetical protein
MPAYSPIRRSTRHVGKVINYNKQSDTIDKQIKEAVQTDKRKYREDWKKKEKAFDEYIDSLLKPESPPERKPLTSYKWEDQYETMEAFRDDIAKVLEMGEEKAKVVNDSLKNAKTDVAHMAYLAYFTKHSILEAEESGRFWEKEWRRREQLAKDNAFWTPARMETMWIALNKLIENDFTIADIIMRIIASTSTVDITKGVGVEDLPHKSLYKLKDYMEYATRKMRNEKRKKRR